MVSSKISERRIKSFKRFLARMPHGKDVDLVILKAHLLIEEEVNAISRTRLSDPDVLLAEERLESFYRIRLAQAFFEPGFRPWLWHALTQLNRLRNRVAHTVDPKGRENIMEDIVHSVDRAAKEDARPLLERFEYALWLLHEAVSSLVEPQAASVLELVPRDNAT